MPRGVTTLQIIRIIKKYLADYPEKAHHPTRDIASICVGACIPVKCRKVIQPWRFGLSVLFSEHLGCKTKQRSDLFTDYSQDYGQRSSRFVDTSQPRHHLFIVIFPLDNNSACNI
jgi:hypothetical protein